jgi:molybdopterin converting factor small subunit
MAGSNDEGVRGPGDAPVVVTVRLFAGLERLTPDRSPEQRVPLSEARTVAALCEAVGLAPGAAGLVLVNGVHAGATHALAAGDEVSLFPPVGGG